MVLGLSTTEVLYFVLGVMAGSYPLAFIAGSFYQRYKTQKGDTLDG